MCVVFLYNGDDRPPKNLLDHENRGKNKKPRSNEFIVSMPERKILAPIDGKFLLPTKAKGKPNKTQRDSSKATLQTALSHFQNREGAFALTNPAMCCLVVVFPEVSADHDLHALVQNVLEVWQHTDSPWASTVWSFHDDATAERALRSVPANASCQARLLAEAAQSAESRWPRALLFAGHAKISGTREHPPSAKKNDSAPQQDAALLVQTNGCTDQRTSTAPNEEGHRLRPERLRRIHKEANRVIRTFLKRDLATLVRQTEAGAIDDEALRAIAAATGLPRLLAETFECGLSPTEELLSANMTPTDAKSNGDESCDANDSADRRSQRHFLLRIKHLIETIRRVGVAERLAGEVTAGITRSAWEKMRAAKKAKKRGPAFDEALGDVHKTSRGHVKSALDSLRARAEPTAQASNIIRLLCAPAPRDTKLCALLWLHGTSANYAAKTKDKRKQRVAAAGEDERESTAFLGLSGLVLSKNRIRSLTAKDRLFDVDNEFKSRFELAFPRINPIPPLVAARSLLEEYALLEDVKNFHCRISEHMADSLLYSFAGVAVHELHPTGHGLAGPIPPEQQSLRHLCTDRHRVHPRRELTEDMETTLGKPSHKRAGTNTNTLKALWESHAPSNDRTPNDAHLPMMELPPHGRHVAADVKVHHMFTWPGKPVLVVAHAG